MRKSATALANPPGPAAALAALTGIWGYNWVVMKVALVDSPALTFSALRSVLSAAALFVVLIAMRRPLAPARGRSLILFGLLQTMGFVGLAAMALEVGAAGKSAVLAYTMPFWTLLLAGPLLGERIRGMPWLAVGLAAAGLVGILSPWRAEFGVAVVFSPDERYMLVGAPAEDVGENADQGVVHVFRRQGIVWKEIQKLTASDGESDDRFGSARARRPQGRSTRSSAPLRRSLRGVRIP